MSFLNELAEIESDPRYAQLAPDIRTTVLDNWEKAASAGKSGVEAEAAASAARTLLESRQSRLKARLPASPLGTLADVPPPLSALTSDPRWGTLDPTVRKQTIDNWAGAKAKTAIDAKLRPSEAMSMYREVVAGQVMAEGPEKPDEAFNARLNADVQDISSITKDPTVRAGGFRAGKINDKFVVNPALALAGEDEYAKAVDEADATPVEKLRAKALYGVGKDAALKSVADITTRAVSDSRTDWGSLNPLAPKGIDSIPTVVIGDKTIDFDDAAEIAITPARTAMYGKKGGSQEALFSTNEGVRKEAEIRTAQQLARYVLPAIGADAAAARVLENPEGPEAKELVEAHRDTLKQELWVEAGNIDNNVFEKGRMLSNGTPVFNPNWARSNPDPKDIEDVIQKVGITASVDDVKEGIKNEARASAARLVLRAGLEEQTERPVSWMPSLASLSPVIDALADLGTNALPNKFRNYVAEKQKAGVTDPLTIVDGYEKEYGMLTDDVSIGLRKAVAQIKSIAAGVSGILGTVAEQFGGANATSKFLTGLSADIIKETSEAEQLQSELTGSNAGFGSTVTQSIATEAPFMAVGLLAGRAASAARHAAVRSATPEVAAAALKRKMAIAASMTPELAASADALINSGSGILKTYFGLQASRSFGGVYDSTYTAQKERALRMGRTEEEADRDARVSSILPSIAGGVATAVLMKMFPGGSEEAIRSMATKESVESVMARAGTAMGAKGGENVIVNAFRNVQALRSTKEFARTYFSQNILQRVGLKTFAGMADEALEETIDEAFQGMLGSVYDERTTLQDVVTNALQAGGIGAIIGGGASGIAAYKESLKVIRDAKKNKPVSPDVAPVVADLEANGDVATAEALRTAASAPDNFQVAIDKLNGFDEVAGKGRFNFVFEAASESEDELPIAKFVVPVEDPDPAKAAAAMAATVASVEEAIAADPDLKDMLVVSGDAANGIVTLTPSIGAVTSWAAGAAGSAPVLNYAQQYTQWLSDKTAAAETAGDAEYDALSAKHQTQLQAASDAAKELVNNRPAYDLVMAKGNKSAKWQEEFAKLPPNVQAQVTSARAAADSANELNAARIRLLERMFPDTKPVNPDKKERKAKAPKAEAPAAGEAPTETPAPTEVDIEPAVPLSADVLSKEITSSVQTQYSLEEGDPRIEGAEALIAESIEILGRAAAAINKKAADLRSKGQLSQGTLETYRGWYADLDAAIRGAQWKNANTLLSNLRDKLGDSSLIFTNKHSEVFAVRKPAPEPKEPTAPKAKPEKPPIPALEKMDDIVLPEGATDEQKALFEQLKKAIAAFPESARGKVNAWIVSLRDGLAKTGLMQLEGTRSVIRRALSGSRDEAFKDRVAAAIGLDTYTNLAAKWKKPTKSKKRVPKPTAEAAESADTRGEDEEEAPAPAKAPAPASSKKAPAKPQRVRDVGNDRGAEGWSGIVGEDLLKQMAAAAGKSVKGLVWKDVEFASDALYREIVSKIVAANESLAELEAPGPERLARHSNIVEALMSQDPTARPDRLSMPTDDGGTTTPTDVVVGLVTAFGDDISPVLLTANSRGFVGEEVDEVINGVRNALTWRAYLWALGQQAARKPNPIIRARIAERAGVLFDAMSDQATARKKIMVPGGRVEEDRTAFINAVLDPDKSNDAGDKWLNNVRTVMRPKTLQQLKKLLANTGADMLLSSQSAGAKVRAITAGEVDPATLAAADSGSKWASEDDAKRFASAKKKMQERFSIYVEEGMTADEVETASSALATFAVSGEKAAKGSAEETALQKLASMVNEAMGGSSAAKTYTVETFYEKMAPKERLKTREADTRTEEIDAIRAEFDAAVAALGGDVTTDLGAVLKRIAADKGNSYAGIAEILYRGNAASFVQGVTIIDDPDKEPAFYDPDSKTITFNRAVASVRGFTDDIVHEVLHAATDSFLSQKHPAGSPEAKIVEELLAIQTTLLARFKAASPSWKTALGTEEGAPDFFSDLVALRAATLLESDKRAWLRENAAAVYEETMTGDEVSELFYKESLKDAATRRQGLIDVLRDFEYALGETSEFKAYDNGIFKEFLTLMYTSPVFQEAAQNARELNTPGEQAGPKFFTKFVKAIRGMLGTLVKSRTTAPVKVPDYSILRDLLAAQEESRSVASRRPGPTVAPVIAPPVITPPVIAPPRAPSITKPRRPTFGSAKPAPTAAPAAQPTPIRNVASLTVPPSYNTPAFASAFEDAVAQAMKVTGFERGLSNITVRTSPSMFSEGLTLPPAARTITLSQGAANRLAAGFATADDAQEVITGIEGIIEDEHAVFWGREPEVLGTRRRDSAVRRLPQYLRDALPEDEAQDIEDMYSVFTGASRNSPFTLDDAIYAGRATRMALTWLLNEDLRRVISNGNPAEGAKAADLSHALSVLTESGGDVAGKAVSDIYAMRTAPGLRETALKAFAPLGISIKSRIASTPGFFTPRALRIDDKFHATTRALSDARNIFSTVSSTASPDTLVWKLMTVKDPAKLLALVPESSRPALEAARAALRSNYAEITTKSLGTLTGMQELWYLASRLEVLKEASVNPVSTANSRGMMIPRLAAVLKEAGLDTDEILPVRQQMATYKDDAARFSNVVSEAARTAVNRFAMGKKVPAGARLEFMAAGSEALAFRDKAQGLVYKIKLPQRMGADTGFSFDVAPPTAAPEEGEFLFNLTDGLGRSSLWNELNEMHTAVPGIVDHEVVGFTDFGALITVQRDVRGQAYSPAEDEGVIEEWMDANGAKRVPAGRLYSEDFARDATSNAFTVTDAAGFTRILADVRPANASVVNGAFLLFDPAISPAVEGEAKELLGTRRRETQSLIPSLTTFFGLTTVPGEVASRARLIEAALGITRLSRWASEKGKWGSLYKVQKELENNVQRAVTLTETLFSTITSRMDKAGLNSRNMTAEQKRQAADIDTILGTIDTLRDEQAAQAAEKERSRARRRVAMGIAQRRKLADQMTPANRMRESASIATDANLQYAQIESAYFDAIIAAESASTAAFKQKQADAAARLKADGLTNVLEAAQNLRNHLNDLSLKIQATTGADSRVRAHYNARMGIHLSRYYEIHDNPAYAAWLWGSDPEAVKLRTAGITWIRNARATRFAADLKSRMRGATTQEIERVAKEMASKLDDSGLMQELNDVIQKHMNRGGVGGVGSPGMLNGTILMERMNVPKELRELLGDYRDHVATAARTALEMGIYYANYVYLDGIRTELQSRQSKRNKQFEDLINKGPLRTDAENKELERLRGTYFITDDAKLAAEYGLKAFKPKTTMINKAAFGPLNAFYGPEITVEAMNDLEGGGGTNAVLSGYAELLGITMKSFTVWNVRGQARNFLSSIAFIPASGHLSMPVWRQSALEGNDKASAFFKNFRSLGNSRLKDRMAAIGVEKAVAEFTDMYVKRGIIGGSDAAVFREEMRKVAGKDYGAAVGRVLDKYNSSASTVTTKASDAAEVFKAIDRFMTEVHRGSDDYFKKILFELEYDARLKEFGVEVKDGVPVMTDKAARRIVEVYGNKGLLTPANEAEVGGDVKARAQLLMEIVSAEATFSKIPYYNRLPEVVNAFKRQKLGLVTAPFISWPAAIWSQPFKAYKQYQQDRAVPETADRAWKTAVAYGATVAGWNLFVGTTLSAIVWALSHLGLGDEDKKIRPVFGLFTPESRALQDFLNKDFYKYRSIALLGMRGENPVWADVSWMTPWSTITDTVTPFFHPRARESSTDFIEAAKASLDKVLKTVLSPQIPISNAFDALTADDFRTKNASFGEKLIKVAGAVAAPLVPMTVKDVAKVVNARNTERFATEAVSTVLGLKINETDIRESLARTARAVAAQDAETMDRYRRLLTNGRADDIGNLETLYDEGMKDMRRLYLDLYQKMGSGSVFLGSDTEVRKIVREDGRGLGFERLQDLYNGVIRGWKPGPTTLERAARMATKEGGDDRVRKATELPVKYGVQSLSQ